MLPETRLWPFPIAKSESDWDEYDRGFVELMRTSFSEGFQPRVGLSEVSVELGKCGNGRSVLLVFRGRRNGWEPFLAEGNGSVRLGPSYGLSLGESACVCVRPPFRSAAHLALEWMRGRSLKSLLEDFEFVGGYPAGVVLRGAVSSRPIAVPLEF
jgi:hypothetical protein